MYARTLLPLVALSLSVLAGRPASGQGTPPNLDVVIEDVTCEQRGSGRWCAVPMSGTIDHKRVKQLRCKLMVKTPKAALVEIKACGKVIASKKGGSKNGSTLVIPFPLAKVRQTCGSPDDGGSAQLEVVPQGVAAGVKVPLEFKSMGTAPCK